MAVYLLISRMTPNHPVLAARLAELFPDSHFTIDDGFWLISSKGTARSLYDKLIPDEDEILKVSAGVTVFRINSYWGLASAEMWDWVDEATKKGASTASA